MSSVYGYYSSSITKSSTTSLGISGLVSGMDIDATVDAMCSSTNSKISKVKQNLMKLEWKQAAYQEVGTSMTDFKNKYLSSSSTSSISSLFANCYNITSEGTNSSAVSASGSADILENFSILGISQLASTASFTTSGSITSPVIKSGSIDFSDTPVKKSTLTDKTLSLNIGSDTYTLKFDDTVITDADSLLTAINNAIGKVDGLSDKLEASTTSDGKLTLTSKVSGSYVAVNSSNNSTVLKALGLQPKAAVGQGQTGVSYLNGTTITGQAPDYSLATKEVSFFSSLADGNKSFTLDLDGTKANIKFTADMINDIKQAGDNATGDKNAAMLDEMMKQMQSQIDKVFGSGKVKITDQSSTENGKTSYAFGFECTERNSILSVASGSSELVGSSGVLGLNIGDANRLLLNEKLDESNFANKFDFSNGKTYDLEINGVKFSIGKESITIDGKTTEYKSGVTMKKVMSAINSSDANVKISYLSTTDRFTITSTVSGAAGDVSVSGSFADTVFGNGAAGSGTIGKNVTPGTNGAAGEFSKGTDAEMLVSFDGKSVEKITRSTNQFKLDGLSLNLTSVFNKDDVDSYNATNGVGFNIADVEGAVTFSKSVNTEDLSNAIKEMVEDYNKMIDQVMNFYKTKRDKDYQPLTETMIEDEGLSEEQAELYNDKAKEGILFGDSILRMLSNDMSDIFIGLSSIGITTSSDYKEYGKLSFDEAAFKAAMETDSAGVADKFTNDDTGILAKLDSMMEKYVGTSLVTPGLITSTAGLASSSLSQMNSTIYSEKKELNDRLKELNTKLETQQDRYYSRFTNMEVAMSKIQSQGSYLSSMMSY